MVLITEALKAILSVSQYLLVQIARYAKKKKDIQENVIKLLGKLVSFCIFSLNTVQFSQSSCLKSSRSQLSVGTDDSFSTFSFLSTGFPKYMNSKPSTWWYNNNSEVYRHRKGLLCVFRDRSRHYLCVLITELSFLSARLPKRWSSCTVNLINCVLFVAW